MGLIFSAKSAKEKGADPLTGKLTFEPVAAVETVVLSDPASPMLGPTEKRRTPATDIAKKPIRRISNTMKNGCRYLKSIFIKTLHQTLPPGRAIPA